MKTQPIVSVLIPVYNAKNYLHRCLDSIINQSYQNLQIVIIDDGSYDDSFIICQQYAANDSRIEVYHQENHGIAATRNNLLKKVIGDYVLFIDSDDWTETNMINQLISLCNAYNADIVMCDKVIDDNPPKQNEQGIYIIDQKQAIKDFLNHNYLDGSLWNKLIKTSLLHGIMFQQDISYGEDALFCWQLLQKIKKMVVTREQLYHYRTTGSSLSRLYNGHQFTAYKVWKIITNEVALSSPEYLSLAQAQFCNQMTVILYNAARNGYLRDSNTDKLCKIISIYKQQMKENGCSIKKYIFASLLCKHYSLIRLILKNN